MKPITIIVFAGLLMMILGAVQAQNETAIPRLSAIQDSEQQAKLLLTIYQAGNVLAWDTNGNHIFTVWDRDIRVWNILTLTQIYNWRHPMPVNQAVLNADGTRLLTRYDRGVKVWDVVSGNELFTLPHPEAHVVGVAWSIDESRILTWYYWQNPQNGLDTGPSSISIWDAISGDNLFTIRLIAEDLQPFGNDLDWNMSQTRFLSWNEDSSVRVWNLGENENAIYAAVQFSLHHETINWIDGAAWSPDETRILSWSSDAVRIWDANSGDLLLTINDDGYVVDARWDMDGSRIFTQDLEREGFIIWDAETGDELIQIGNINQRTDLAVWSRDGSQVLVRSWLVHRDPSILDTQTGEELQSLNTPFDTFSYALWGTDGNLLLIQIGSLFRFG